MSFDVSARIGDIARRILGEPNEVHSTRNQLRFGAHGSVAVEVAGDKAGTWFDHENKLGGGARDLVRIRCGIPEPDIDAWLQQQFGAMQIGRKTGQRIAKPYDYRERGQLIYQVIRYEPKAFRQRRPGPAGRWIYDLKGVRPVLYRLDELRGAPDAPIYIAEGEKDADNLAAIGLISTCNSGGAGKWRSHFAAEFRNRDVMVIPDGDDAGRSHAQAVAANVAPVARSVRILELPGLPPKGDVTDWLLAGGTRERLEALAADTPLYQPAALPVIGGLRVVGFDDMRPRLADGYLIKHVFGSTAFAVMFGAAGTGKTYLALHLGLKIAAGEECFGRRVRRAGVVYIAAEAGRSIENRVAAAKHEFDFPKTMPFAAITTPVDLCTDSVDTEKLIAAIGSVDLGLPIELIIVDTLSRTMGGGSEDQSAVMGAFVANIDRLRAATGAAVLIIHHSGKDATRGARGHSLLRAAVDTEIEISRGDLESGILVARVTKQREYATDGSLFFSLRQVEIGIDADGDPVTACVVDEATAPTSNRQPKAKPLAPAQQRALQLLHRAVDEAGEVPTASSHMPAGQRCVTEEKWRQYCYRGSVSSGDQDAKRMAFKRAAEALVASGRVGKWEPFVWLS